MQNFQFSWGETKIEHSHIEHNIFILVHFNDKYNHPLEKEKITPGKFTQPQIHNNWSR